MYFHLHPSLESINFAKDINALDALENLLAAAFGGQHVVFGDLQTLRKLRTINELGLRGKAVLDYLINWHPQTKDFYAKLEFRTSVEYGISTVMTLG
ncbi:MAG: hypothetical protein K2X81_20835, partial [Candidatus Obscuribacterales bacterium]|nr:hypothetical protein [Candidatus Obscuribacterales bacterium]